MNNPREASIDDIKAFQLLSEVTDEQPLSQRELANRLGIALGLVNSYIKNFVAKGFIRIKNYPHNRYAYLLTPSGMAEKARLAYQHVNYFTSLYTVTRNDYLLLFRQVAQANVGKVAFCGVDEVAEIAWLSLQETGLRLAGVYDDRMAGGEFFGCRIGGLGELPLGDGTLLVVTSLKRGDQLRNSLLEMGVDERLILRPASGAGLAATTGEEHA